MADHDPGKSILIAGAGIAGPAAALTMARAGHAVTVYETRDESDLFSPGVIGITDDNWSGLTDCGVDCESIEQDNSYTDYSTGKTTKWDGHYVMWTNLHRLLVKAAREAGAVFLFGQEYRGEDPGTDYLVRAQGVGYAKTWRPTDYTGYVVYRGLSADETDYAWLAVPDAGKRWSFKLARTDFGASWELYTHVTADKLGGQWGTVELPGVNPFAYEGLPAQFRHYIRDTTTIYRAAISDWEPPSMIAFEGSRGGTFIIGDANGPMRPHTGMGANLGISEALALPHMLRPANAHSNEVREAELIRRRRYQHDRGIRMGRALLGS